MSLLRTFALPLLGLALLAAPAAAQTRPNKMARRPQARVVPNTSPAARAADPLRGTNDNGKGQSGYAAPGQPLNVQDNGKNTPPYDGPAAGRTTPPAKGMTLPPKKQ